MLQRRINANSYEVYNLSLEICEKFYKEFSDKNKFLLYWPIKNEVDISSLLSKFLDEDKEVYLPGIENNKIVFKLLKGMNSLIKGKYNIYESTGKYLDSDFDIIVVPAVAYDISCYRLGYGMGFYDRFFQSCGYKGIRAGVAYDYQITDTVYPEEFDEPVDIIITDKRVIRRS